MVGVMNTQPVIDGLFQSDNLSVAHKEEVQALHTEHAKANFLFERVLLRGNFQKVAQFIAVLQRTGYHTNEEVATGLQTEVMDTPDGTQPG